MHPLDGPLHMALYHGHVDAVRLLLKHGANVNKPGKYARTPIFIACRTYFDDHYHSYNMDHIYMINLLHSYGANPNVGTNTLNMPLICAIAEDSYDIVRVLHSIGADIDRTSDNELTPLIYAIENDNKGMVELLLQLGADVTKSEQWGEPLLHYLVRSGRKDMVELLLNYGIVANTKDRHQHGAIWIAKCVIQDTDMVDLLISRGATYY
jgi:ankyrin repeat protein